MSIEAVTNTERSAAATYGERAAAAWAPIERVLTRLGDFLNPILVKETRQALKSSQFTFTFVLVLVACWLVTIGGVAYIGPGIYYSAAGGSLFICYFGILAVALGIVVPYAAFRSLAAEREDNTYDLLTITTLKPWQIISGKLGSSVVQMAVYYSAIAPCLAFTYLLRGIDVPTIVMLLLYAFLGSLGLSMVGLLLATLTKQRVGQIFLSVAFIAGLIWFLFMSMFMAIAMMSESYMLLGNDAFWVINLGFLTVYATSFALAFFAAAAMISFPSENRSTPLRICMVLQQATFIGWMGVGWLYSMSSAVGFDIEWILAMATMAGIYWYVMGTMLTSELPEMSRRVKRRLPSSTLGRALFTWFMPGPASGYLFVVANATAIVVIGLIGIVISLVAGQVGGGGLGADELVYLLIIGWGYLVAYLGLGLIVVTSLRRIALVTMLACVLINCLLVLAGSGLPMAIQMMSIQLRYVEYSYLQVANPIWSLMHVAKNGAYTEGTVLVLVVPAAAVCMLLLNLRAVVRELRQVRIAPPTRVIEDEAELHPPPQARPQSPWDMPERVES